MIYTIGHSNAEMDKFVGLLQFYNIELLVDVRSMPTAKYAHWFNKATLEEAMGEAGITYRFLGRFLGGKPSDPAVLSPNGRPDYDLIKKTNYFREGIDELVRLALRGPLAVMCAEENPENCHRSLLIAPVMEAKGFEVDHIRHDGSLVKNGQLRPQLSLPF